MRYETHMSAPTPILPMSIASWDAVPTQDDQAEAIRTVESGGIVLFPGLAFTLETAEQICPADTWKDEKSKSISLDLASGVLVGAQGAPADLERMRGVIRRFADASRQLIASVFPQYGRALVATPTTFRPSAAEHRETAWRQDDRRLHVDAFPRRPNRGARILRVFSNVNPRGEARIWRVGEPFEDVAQRFLPAIRPALPGSARLLDLLGRTRGRRSPYDHIMLQLHDRMKADALYQREARQSEVTFPSGCTWSCFSDQISHAVVRGQFMFEQSFYVPLSALQTPEQAPLRVLERLVGHRLT